MTFEKFIKWREPVLTAERPQLLEVARALGQWWEDDEGRQVFNLSMPTRFGKSLLATYFSVWILLQDSTQRIMRVCYSAELAESLGVQVQRKYLEFFESCGLPLPLIEGTRAKWRIGDGDLVNHIAVGVGGSITGFGFDLVICDDMTKSMAEAMSGAYKRQLVIFRDSVLYGRLEGKRKILNVGTRWAIDDWFSLFVEAQELRLPAMLANGRSFCEAWKTTEELQGERAIVGNDVWSAQYQQAPTATGVVQLFEDVKFEIVGDIPDGQRLLVADPATNYGSDYFVVGEYAKCGGFIYLCDMYAQQAASVADVAEWIKHKNFAVCYVETNGVGRNIINELRRNGCSRLVGFSTGKSKYLRAFVQRERIINYFRIFAGLKEEIMRELLSEFSDFPNINKHDDLLDNVVMMFERLKW